MEKLPGNEYYWMPYERRDLRISLDRIVLRTFVVLHFIVATKDQAHPATFHPSLNPNQ